MRIASWNIRQGGGRRLNDICSTLSELAPDLVALQEVRSSSAAALEDELKSSGLSHSYQAETTQSGENTLFIASRQPIDAGEFITDREGPCHLIEAETAGLTLLVAHFPQKALQVPLFEALLNDSPSLLTLPSLLIGDLNCGIPFVDSSAKTFVNTKYFQALLETGWVDLYRQANGADARDFSWISPRTKRGFRYDHALASRALSPALTRCEYLHAPRDSGFSDHSVLVVELDGYSSTL